MSDKRSKSIASVLAGLSFIPSASAQSFSGAESTLVEFFNEFVFYGFQANSVAEITLFFVAPLFAFYMINKNIFKIGFESFEDRVSRSDYSTVSNQEDLPTGLKGLALAVAFITVQVVGLIGTFMMLALTALAYGAWILHWTGLFGDFAGSGSSSSSGGGDGSSEVQEEIEELREENEELRDEIDSVESEQQEDESEMDSGEEGPEEAESHIERELSQLNTVEEQLEEMEGQIETIESQIYSQEQQTEQEEQEELQYIQALESQQQKLFQALDQIEAVESDALDAEGQIDKMVTSSRVQSPDQINSEQNQRVRTRRLEDLKQMEKLFDQLREMEGEEFQELKQTLEDEKEVLSEINNQGSEIGALEEQIKELFQESELLESLFESEEDVLSMAERLAEQVKDREDYKQLEQEEQIVDDLEQKFNSILNKEQQLRENIQELEQEHQAEQTRHQEALNELVDLEKSFEKTLEILEEIDEGLNQFLQESEQEAEAMEDIAEGLSGVAERAMENQGDSPPGEYESTAQEAYHSMEGDQEKSWEGVQQDYEAAVELATDLKQKLNSDDSSGQRDLMYLMGSMQSQLGELIEEIESGTEFTTPSDNAVDRID